MATPPQPGVSLPDASASLSLFALARTSREGHLFVNDRRGLQRISLDMEDAVLAEGLPARLFAGFQKWSFVRPALERYRRLARVARGVWVFGLPDIEAPAIPGLTWVSLTEHHALAREWFLVVDADAYFAALAAEDLGGVALAHQQRRFRAVWSVDDAVVHDLAGRLGAALGLPAEPAASRRDYGSQLTRVGATVGRLLALLQERSEALARAERLREDLTTLLLHDLRNPLSVILARTELLTRLGTPTAERVTRSAVAIRSEALRLDEMLLDLLDVARLEAGPPELVRTDLDVRDLVDGLAESVRALATAQEKAMAVGVETAPGTVVRAERDTLVRVLSTLVGNALKYSDRGGHVELRVRATAGAIEFSVSDDGPGVPAAARERERMFQRFGQAGGDTQRPGTGLGLYFCRLVVEAHGGTIGAENRPGRGATFRFSLPAPG